MIVLLTGGLRTLNQINQFTRIFLSLYPNPWSWFYCGLFGRSKLNTWPKVHDYQYHWNFWRITIKKNLQTLLSWWRREKMFHISPWMLFFKHLLGSESRVFQRSSWNECNHVHVSAGRKNINRSNQLQTQNLYGSLNKGYVHGDNLIFSIKERKLSHHLNNAVSQT